MRLRKEVWLFVACALYLGWGVRGMLATREGGPVRGGRRPADASLQYEAGPAPGVARALPLDGSQRGSPGEFSRDLFQPPRDTEPLPPLALEPPPLEPLPVLGPPTAYGPLARHMGDLLRAPLEVTPVPGLFDVAEVEPGLEDEDLDDLDGGAAPLRGLGYAGDAPAQVDDRELTPEERLERIEARKKLYDWVVRPSGIKFGHIKNVDRYDLRRTNDPILFVEVDPDTGAEAYPGADPIPVDRTLIDDFGLADTAPNRIELRRRDFGAEVLRPGDFEPALDFAVQCIELRNEAPRALDVAEEVLRMCVAVHPRDARPRIVLARMLEAGFRFEEAFDTYRELTTGELRADPAPWAYLGDLYARFRMFGKAETCYTEALRRGRTNYLARWRYGRFLLERGRAEEALGHLAEASQRAPTDLVRPVRVGIRADHGRALVALGRPREALELFRRAQSADPDDDAGLAGIYSASLLLRGEDGELPDATEGQGGDVPDASFDLLVATGLAALQEGQWEAARTFLEAAAAADPFRAHLALRALSALAERTGHPEEALGFAQRAYEVDPTDAWTLYQRGRLLAAAGDTEGAVESLRAALDRELDFPDALVAMAVLAQEAGDHEAAERYYERALGLEDSLPEAHARRGFNALDLGDLELAEAAFQAALRARPDLASARNGLAWWRYASGDAAGAMNGFAELVDLRRNLPEGDAQRAWAEAQTARILDHQSKEVWRDRFDRVGRIGNEWSFNLDVGPEVRLREGAAWIEGRITLDDGRTRLMRDLPADRLLSFEAQLTIGSDTPTGVEVGIFVARETEGRNQARVHAAVELVRNRTDGKVQARFVRQGEVDSSTRDLPGVEWPLGEPLRLRIEKAGETQADTVVSLYMNDVAVLERTPLQSLGRTSAPLVFGVFAGGDAGREVEVRVDEVSVVRRRL